MTDHFQPDGGIAGAHLVDQLAGNGQSIDNLAFITSLASGNLELLAVHPGADVVEAREQEGGAVVLQPPLQHGPLWACERRFRWFGDDEVTRHEAAL